MAAPVLRESGPAQIRGIKRERSGAGAEDAHEDYVVRSVLHDPSRAMPTMSNAKRKWAYTALQEPEGLFLDLAHPDLVPARVRLAAWERLSQLRQTLEAGASEDATRQRTAQKRRLLWLLHEALQEAAAEVEQSEAFQASLLGQAVFQYPTVEDFSCMVRRCVRCRTWEPLQWVSIQAEECAINAKWARKVCAMEETASVPKVVRAYYDKQDNCAASKSWSARFESSTESDPLLWCFSSNRSFRQGKSDPSASAASDVARWQLQRSRKGNMSLYCTMCWSHFGTPDGLAAPPVRAVSALDLAQWDKWCEQCATHWNDRFLWNRSSASRP